MAETQAGDPAQLKLVDKTKTSSKASWHKKKTLLNYIKVHSSDDDRYSGPTQDNFDQTFVLFEKRCQEADLDDDDPHRTFSIMLWMEVRQFRLNSLQIQMLSLDKLAGWTKVGATIFGVGT